MDFDLTLSDEEIEFMIRALDFYINLQKELIIEIGKSKEKFDTNISEDSFKMEVYEKLQKKLSQMILYESDGTA